MPIHEGNDAAIADFNAQGGIGGRKVRVITLDDGFDAKRTLDNAHQLIERDGVVALFAQAGTSQVMALLPYLERVRTPLIGVYTGSPAPRAIASPWLFTTSASYADELTQMVRNLVAIQTTRIGVAYEDSDFGKLTLPLVERAAAAEGATIVAAQSMASNGSTAAEAARALGAKQPQAVVMIAAGPPVVAYVREHRAQLGVPLYTLSLGAGTQVLRALGEDARGLAVARSTPSPQRANLQVTRDFQASMKRHGLEPDYDHFVGYLDARVLLEGLRAAGPARQRGRGRARHGRPGPARPGRPHVPLWPGRAQWVALRGHRSGGRGREVRARAARGAPAPGRQWPPRFLPPLCHVS